MNVEYPDTPRMRLIEALIEVDQASQEDWNPTALIEFVAQWFDDVASRHWVSVEGLEELWRKDTAEKEIA